MVNCMVKRRKSLSPRGFTLVELLVVLGLIAVLIGLAITGFRTMENTSKTRQTKLMMGNIASMFAEYDAATGLKRQPAYMYNTSGAQYTAAGRNIWTDADPVLADFQAMAAPTGLMESGEPSRTTSQAVQNTAVVMKEVLSMPGAKKLITQLGSDALMKTASEPIPGETNATIPLDGWGNPIIFVPAAGLRGVYIGATGPTDPNAAAGNPFVVRSNKVYSGTDPAVNNPAVLPPDARPFFASAGKDGKFETGDDNVYSFEN